MRENIGIFTNEENCCKINWSKTDTPHNYTWLSKQMHSWSSNVAPYHICTHSVLRVNVKNENDDHMCITATNGKTQITVWNSKRANTSKTSLTIVLVTECELRSPSAGDRWSILARRKFVVILARRKLVTTCLILFLLSTTLINHNRIRSFWHRPNICRVERWQRILLRTQPWLVVRPVPTFPCHVSTTSFHQPAHYLHTRTKLHQRYVFCVV